MATIQGVYVALFGRPADPLGLAFFNTATSNGANLNAIGNLASTAEYQTRFTGQSNVQIINSIYQSLFGRDADVAGLTFFANQLSSGRQTINTIAINILDGATGSDLTTVNNKIAAANLYTAAIDTGSEIVAYSGTVAADAGRAFISGVTTTVPTAAAVDTAVANMVANPGPATTVSLTTSAETLTGTNGADAFAASVVFDVNEAVTTASTLTVADQIAGGAGTDILNLTVSGAQDGAVVLPAATISGVEIFNIRNTVGQTASLDASNFAGVTAVNADRSIGAVTVTNLASGASAGMTGDGTVTNGALNAGYAAAATASTINIAGGTKAGAVTVTGNGVTSATINSTGAANTIGAYAGAATTTSTTINAATALTTGAVTNAGATLTINGAGAVNLSATALEAGVTTVNASANTGGVTVALGTAVTQTVTGGTGNDVITSGAVLTTGSVNAGAGTDTLVLGTNVTHANTAALAAKYTNFETLRVNGTFDASLIAGINAVELSGATNNISKLSVAQAAAVTALADIGATTLALATDTGTTDVVNLTLGNGNGAAFDTGALTVNGVETLNIRANAKSDNADKTSVIASFTADKLTAINLTGSAVTLTNAAVASAVAINGSALTGTGGATPTGLTVAGNLVKGSVVTGSAFADTLTTTAAIAGTTGDFVTYNAGAGNDTISTTAAAINNTSAANGSLRIDGGAGTDTLTLTDAASLTLVDANFQNVTNIETIGYAVADKAISITSGGFFDTNFKASGVTLNLGDGTNAQVNTVNLQSFTGNATVSLTATAATTQAQTIVTGSGNDTVTLLAAGTTTGAHSISTGAGTDTINVTINGTDITTGAVTINAGAGQDTITITGNTTANADTASNVVLRVNEGHSTLSAFDSVNGFVLNTASKVATSVDFDGTAGVAANVAATAAAGFTNVNYTITNGLLAFTGTGAAALTSTQKATIAQNVVTAADATVVFTDGSDSYVFHNGVTTDDLVKLVGVSAAGAEATVSTSNFVLIA